MITLSYGFKTITLRNPDFGNKQSIEIARINRKNRGGDLLIFRDSNWPITEILDYTFTFLSQKQVNDLLEFLEYSLGQIITLIDYENKTWSGIIITPVGNIIQSGINNIQAQFQFQGTYLNPRRIIHKYWCFNR